MGERLLCKQEVIGSIPFSSTKTEREDRDRRGARAGSGAFGSLVVEEARGSPRAIGFEPKVARRDV